MTFTKHDAVFARTMIKEGWSAGEAKYYKEILYEGY